MLVGMRSRLAQFAYSGILTSFLMSSSAFALFHLFGDSFDEVAVDAKTKSPVV